MDAENSDLFITQDTFIPDETADIEESAIGFCELLDADLTQLINGETRESNFDNDDRMALELSEFMAMGDSFDETLSQIDLVPIMLNNQSPVRAAENSSKADNVSANEQGYHADPRFKYVSDEQANINATKRQVYM